MLLLLLPLLPVPIVAVAAAAAAAAPVVQQRADLVETQGFLPSAQLSQRGKRLTTHRRRRRRRRRRHFHGRGWSGHKGENHRDRLCSDDHLPLWSSQFHQHHPFCINLSFE